MDRKQHDLLKLADKIYLNSYECMWNDAMIHSHKNNFFYFYNPKTIGKITEISQKQINNIKIIMSKEEIFRILKEAAGFVLNKDGYGFGSISRTFKGDNNYDYCYSHYPKMKTLLESLPWEKIVQNPYNPKSDEYPTEDGIYITMMDANEHEVCTNTFRDGHFVWMDRTHIKWWMKLP